MKNSLLWIVFFSICLGLGYPTLNRYDPRKTPGVIHAEEHGATVSGAGSPVMQNRVLVSYVAKPFHWIAKGRIGTWDPVLFGLLVSNCLFTATTALLLMLVGQKATGDAATALLGGLIYLLNFDVANYQLAGQVDAAECCFLMAVIATLSSRNWTWLPLWGVLGGLSKETFAPAALPLAFAWGVVVYQQGGLKPAQALSLAALALGAVATTAVALSLNSGQSLWVFFSIQEDPAGAGSLFLPGLLRGVFNHSFLFIFAWLLPLGLIRVRELPRPWVIGSVFGALAVLAIGAFHDAQDSTARVLFHVTGPILSLSVALLLSAPAKR